MSKRPSLLITHYSLRIPHKMIASESNPKIKLVRRLQQERRVREREQLFVVEGARWLAELLAPGAPEPVMLFTTAVFLTDPAHQSLLHQLPLPPLVVPPHLMAAMSDTNTPPGLLAVLPWPRLPWPSQSTLLLILDNLRDPGNMGTLIRTAAAAGVDGVLLSPGCVDPFNPKVVRSSMGGILRLPLHPAPWPEIAARTTGHTRYLAAGEAEQVYTAVDWLPPSALIIGGEADGATSPARELADTAVAIPMAHHTESLNAAIAASIILFEAVRQRSVTTSSP